MKVNRDIIVKFHLPKLQQEAREHDMDYYDYAQKIIFKRLNLNNIEGAELILGDSEATLNLRESVFCVGFKYINEQQFNYLMPHLSEVISESESAMRVEVNTKEPLVVAAVIKSGKIVEAEME